MKPPNTIKYGFRPPEAAEALGSEKLLAECVSAGWIKPILKRHKLTLYDRADIASCWSRILAGEVPRQDGTRDPAGKPQPVKSLKSGKLLL